MTTSEPGPRPVCAVAECNREMKYKKLGLCANHYQKYLRYGTATPTPDMKKKPGPAPDPTKHRSRHNPDNPSRSRPRKDCPRRTHCKRGHALTEENVYLSKRGVRSCRTCLRENTAKWRALNPPEPGPGLGSFNASKTHCPSGHEYSEDNTYVFDGKRQCRACARERSRERLTAKYGLTVAAYEAVLQHQGHACAICHRPADDTPTSLHIDHDHTTGDVRGLLCYKCNSGLGLFGDSPELLLAAAEYLMDSWRLEPDNPSESNKTGSTA